MEILLTRDAWVLFKYQDSTVRTVHTTLNTLLLQKAGAILRTGFLFDLDKGVYVPYDEEADTVEVLGEKPDFESEVLQFGYRFI